MALKGVLANLEGLDEVTKGLYKKGEDGKFYLEVDGLVDKTKLDQFRDNNIKLTEDLKKLQEEFAKFSGMDPEKYKAAMAAIENDQEKKLLKDGKIDEVLNMRTERMRQDYENQLKAKDQAIAKATEDAKKATGERNNYIVEAELRKSVENPEMGFQPGLSDLVKEQVLKEFSFKDGKVVRVKSDGSPVFGKNGDPATINEYLQDIVKDRPYLVKASTGGGARPGQGTGANGAKTMRRAAFDQLTPDAKMEFSKAKGVLVE